MLFAITTKFVADVVGMVIKPVNKKQKNILIRG